MNERIRELRKRLGLNQTEFGAKIGLSQRAIANFEQSGNVTERNINAICQAWSVNPEWLRNGVGEIFIETREAMIQNVAKEFELTEEETALIRTFLELEPEQRAGVMAFIKNFAQNNIHAAKPDSELTPDEAAETARQERADELSAQKRVTSTSSASIGTSGLSKKIGRSP